MKKERIDRFMALEDRQVFKYVGKLIYERIGKHMYVIHLYDIVLDNPVTLAELAIVNLKKELGEDELKKQVEYFEKFPKRKERQERYLRKKEKKQRQKDKYKAKRMGKEIKEVKQMGKDIYIKDKNDSERVDKVIDIVAQKTKMRLFRKELWNIVLQDPEALADIVIDNLNKRMVDAKNKIKLY